jgi:hypothetical protein
MVGRKAYRHFASWRFCRGAIEGFRGRRRDASDARGLRDTRDVGRLAGS